MSFKDDYLKKFQAKPLTKDQGLATEIFESFNRRIPFSRIMFIIQRTGWQATFEAWRESKNADKPVALFLWKAGQNARVIKWQ